MRVPRLFHDALVARPVFVAPDRAGRPGDFGDAPLGLGGPARCPFCAGNESLTPPEVLRAPPAAPGLPGGGPWRSRIVPNRFPFVHDAAESELAGESRGGLAPAEDGPGCAPGRPALGVHDVVVESPHHIASITAIDPPGWREAWLLCRERLAMLAADTSIAWATVFKNSGAAAGASLVHVHSQIVGLAIVPPVIQAELAAASLPHAAADPFTALIDEAAAAGRIVAESAAGLVALVPPAPRQPFETWILPREPVAFFSEAAGAHVESLADLTQSYIGRLESLVPGASYNWWLHQPPFPSPRPRAGTAASGPSDRPRYRWHLEIVPRINGLAGFELGTGCHVSTHLPEDCATQLRGAGSRR